MTDAQFDFLIQLLIVLAVIVVFYLGYSTGSRDSD